MRAMVSEASGGQEGLTWGEVDEPVPGPGEVLIEVAAAGVNRADLHQRQGKHDPPPGASPILGLECSGRIAALGHGVRGWEVGQPVCALLSGGGYAERVVVPSGQLLPIPENIGLRDAAALPEAACTVWSNVVQAARLAEGETLLVHGGAGGVGTHAVQVGKALGARVAVTAGSSRRLECCAALGADILIDYQNEDFAEAVRAHTGGRGADVVLDNMGGPYLGRNIDALAPEGRLMIIGVQGGSSGHVDVLELLEKRATVCGTGLRSRPAREKAAIVDAVRDSLWPLVAAGAVKPVVSQYLPVREAVSAHELLLSGDVVGKLVLTVP